MMQITEQYVTRVRNNLRKHALVIGEIRRVQGLGEHYIALAETKVDDPPFIELYTVAIDGVRYILYARHHEDPA